MLDRVIRRTPAAPHAECHTAALALDAAYQATIARMQHTIDVQTRWIARQDQQIACLKTLAGVPQDVAVTPNSWTDRQRALSRRLDALIARLEMGRDGRIVRAWLRWRKARLERAVFGGER